MLFASQAFAGNDAFSFKKAGTSKTSKSNRVSASTDVSIDAFILHELVEFEKSGGSLSQCQLITNPPLPADFGLTAEIGKGTIDVYKAEYLQKAAQSSSYIKDVADTEKLKWYTNCGFRYAFIVNAVLQKIPDRKYKSISDFQQYVKSTIRKIADSQPSAFDALDTIDFSKCRFAGDMTKIQCGQLYIEIAATPKMLLGKSKVFDPPVYMNLSSKFSVEGAAAKEIANAIEKATGGIAY
jgi:hypothetical protein